MLNQLKSGVASICIASVLHLSLVDAVYAETSAEMQAAAAQANSDLFKADPSSLYSTDDAGNVSIVGVTSGSATLSASDLYYGVEGQSASDGSLPDVDDYESLYTYRDQKLGEMESSTGSYSSTGDLNAEAAALEVLNNSSDISSVSAQEFLLRSREIMNGEAEDTAEFGQCITQQITGSTTYTYDGSTTQSCETLAIDTSAMNASRTYHGPAAVFDYVTESGTGYCVNGENRIAADSAATCGKLSMLTEIPTVTGGTISAQACESASNCAAIVLTQDAETSEAGVSFTVGSNISLSGAQVTGNVVSGDPWISYQGATVALTDNQVELTSVLTTKGSVQTIGIARGGTREPPTGDYWLLDAEAKEYALVTHNFTSVGWYSDLKSATRHTDENGVNYALIAGDSCRYYAGDRGLGEARSIYRICVTDGVAQATLELSFDPTLFSDWVYNATRWAELQSISSDSACSLTFSVTSTAANSSGCVNGFGTAGEVCGSSIAVSPFELLTDRAATAITVTPSCTIAADEENDAFTEGDTCEAFSSDASCTYVGQECTETLSDGTCLVYENQYSCGSTMSYSSPVVQEVNICTSDLSCLGDECTLDTGTDGSGDLADAAGKLAAADMMMSDMVCTQDLTISVNTEEAMLSCTLFKGEEQTCSKVTLGLANCCTTASGVSLADYLQLAFSVSRLSNLIEGTSLANPVTSAWVSMEDLGRDSFSALKQPLVEVWESVVGNSEAAKTAGNALSMTAVKQAMMKKAAQWTAQVFGDQAANAIFQTTVEGVSGPAFSQGAFNGGTVSLTSTAATVMSTVMMAYTIYTLVNVLSGILFACSEGEQELMVRRALKATHRVGTYCSSRVLGKCVKRKTSFCMFSSPLSRILNEQARLQLGIGWGSAENPNCQGITVAQFQTLDMDAVDLSEWTGMLLSSGTVDLDAVTDIEELTGTGSTLGVSLEDLYEREDAIERNTNRYEDLDLDALRQDAVDDFGSGTVQ